MDEFVIVTWHDDIQFFMEQEGFRENAYLINDKKGLDDFGSSAYFVRKSWYLENEPKLLTTQEESDQVKLAKVIALSEIKKLREVTGRGMMDCKKALAESDGDFDEAIKILEKMPKILIHRVNE